MMRKTTCILCTDKNITNKQVNINVNENSIAKLDNQICNTNNDDIIESLYIIISIFEIGTLLDYLLRIDLIRVLTTCKSFRSIRAINPKQLDSILVDTLRIDRDRSAFDMVSGPMPLYSLLDIQDFRSVFSRLKCCWTLNDFYNDVDEITFDNQFVLRGIFSSTNSNVIASVDLYISRGASNSTSVTLNPTDKLCDVCKFVRCDDCSLCENCDICCNNHCSICSITELCDFCFTQLCESCNVVPFLSCFTCGSFCCNNCQEEAEPINQCCDCKRSYCHLCTEVVSCGQCDKVLCDNCQNSDCSDSFSFSICPFCDDEICNSCLDFHKLVCLNL